MSRKIEPKASVTITEDEARLRNTSQGKLLFTSYRGQNCALLIQDDRLTEAAFFPNVPSRIGAVYIGKVKSVVKNIDACFVEIGGGELCFLPLKESASVHHVLNRSYDGRILEGDEFLVQVTRDAQKSKRASVTARISLSNDYFVLSMGPERVCFSAKLGRRKRDELERLLREAGILDPEGSGRLSQACGSLLSGQMLGQMESEGLEIGQFQLPATGAIVRTKAEETESAEELLGHFYALAAQYVRLLYLSRYRSCFSCLKRADTEVEAVLRQFDGSPIGEIVTDQETCYIQLKQSCRENGIEADVRLYQDSIVSLSALYGIESKVREALESRVWLKSGGYLVIEHTEALTVIDVNSGKYDSDRNPQETYRRINLEAAEEVAFQLRLRNLSGIIIVDFINMQSPTDNAQLLQALRSLVKQDKVKTAVVDMTPLGLVEITRKKISRPLREQVGL